MFMRKYIAAYGIWLAAVLAMGAAAVAWYRYVEGVGLDELRTRLTEVEDDGED